MPDFDAGFKFVSHISGRDLARLGKTESDSWAPIVGEVEAVLRLADRAFRAEHGGERFLVYMEAYTYWKSAAPWSVLAKSGLLAERERLPSVNLIYILKPRGYRSQKGTFRLKVHGKTTNQVWFHEVCLWKLKPEAWWESSPGLMALFPLCHHDLDEHQAISYSAQAITHGISDSKVQADTLATLAIFSKLAYPNADVVNWIGREKMKESKFYEEVMTEGRIEGCRNMLMTVIGTRFGNDAVREFESAINSIDDQEILREIARYALSSRIGEFRRKLNSLPVAAK